jgi:hypothetical protein
VITKHNEWICMYVLKVWQCENTTGRLLQTVKLNARSGHDRSERNTEVPKNNRRIKFPFQVLWPYLRTLTIFQMPIFYVKKKKVNCTLVQSLRLCTGHTAHRGSRGIALPFLDQGTRRGWGVSVTHRPLFTPRKDPVPIVQEAAWAPGPIWTGVENLAPPGFDPRTVQPVASRYTDWATRPTNTVCSDV